MISSRLSLGSGGGKMTMRSSVSDADENGNLSVRGALLTTVPAPRYCTRYGVLRTRYEQRGGGGHDDEILLRRCHPPLRTAPSFPPRTIVIHVPLSHVLRPRACSPGPGRGVTT